MKKLFLLLTALLLCSCSAEREEYYTFSFDNYTIAPGYDDVEYMRLVFKVELPETLAAESKLENKEVYFWDKYFGLIDIENRTKKDVPIEQAKISKMILYLDNIGASKYGLDGRDFDSSVKANCDYYGGQYIERNGYACAFGKVVDNRENVVILYGDILAEDQDQLHHIEIYVK